jgi:hypothetical protein
VRKEGLGPNVRVLAIIGLVFFASSGTAFAQVAPSGTPAPATTDALRQALEVQAPALERAPSFPDATTPSVKDRTATPRPKMPGFKATLPPNLKNRIHAAAIGALRSYIKHTGEGHGFGEGPGPRQGSGGEHHGEPGCFHGGGPEGQDRGGGPNMPRPPDRNGGMHGGAQGGPERH